MKLYLTLSFLATFSDGEAIPVALAYEVGPERVRELGNMSIEGIIDAHYEALAEKVDMSAEPAIRFLGLDFYS